MSHRGQDTVFKRKLFKELKLNGCTIKFSLNGHYKVTLPGGKVVTLSRQIINPQFKNKVAKEFSKNGLAITLD